jgi:hypothetical protein
MLFLAKLFVSPQMGSDDGRFSEPIIFLLSHTGHSRTAHCRAWILCILLLVRFYWLIDKKGLPSERRFSTANMQLTFDNWFSLASQQQFPFIFTRVFPNFSPFQPKKEKLWQNFHLYSSAPARSIFIGKFFAQILVCFFKTDFPPLYAHFPRKFDDLPGPSDGPKKFSIISNNLAANLWLNLIVKCNTQNFHIYTLLRWKRINEKLQRLTTTMGAAVVGLYVSPSSRCWRHRHSHAHSFKILVRVLELF